MVNSISAWLCQRPPTPDAAARLSARFERLQRARITLPAQQAEAFIGGEADVFEQDGHCPEIIARNHALSNAVRRYGQ
jgi:hypothetical protein